MLCKQNEGDQRGMKDVIMQGFKGKDGLLGMNMLTN